MVVVDANIIVYAVFQTRERALVERLLEVDDDWRLPTIWKHEVASAAATFVRARQADIKAARAAMDEAIALVGARDVEVDLALAVEAAIALDLSSYDAEYLVLARSLGVPCVTADKKMVRNAAPTAIALDSL